MDYAALALHRDSLLIVERRPRAVHHVKSIIGRVRVFVGEGAVASKVDLLENNLTIDGVHAAEFVMRVEVLG